MIRHLIKTEIEYHRFFWFALFVPLLLCIPILFWTQDTLLTSNKTVFKMILNTGKGLAIMIALLTLRSILDYVGQKRLSAYHLRVPLSLVQLGIVRVCNILMMWLCFLILILLNLYLLPSHLSSPMIQPFLFTMGGVLTLFGFSLLISDTLNIWNMSTTYRIVSLGFVMTGLPLLIFLQVKYVTHLVTPTSIASIIFLGFALIALSIYTFTRLRTYIPKYAS